jgi:hypothetical protein
LAPASPRRFAVRSDHVNRKNDMSIKATALVCICIVLSSLILGLSIATPVIGQGAADQPGRYQLLRTEGPNAGLIDTVTGRCWVARFDEAAGGAAFVEITPKELK